MKLGITMDGMRDPAPYDGPIMRADGARSFNRYLWPLSRDQWTYRWTSWSFSVVALADGRYATCGFISSIERDRTHGEKRCCFPDRRSAIRAVAARMIREVRRCAHAKYSHLRISPLERAKLVEWALEIVAEQTGEPIRTDLVHARMRACAQEQEQEQERQERHLTVGLPLFDTKGNP